MNHRGHRGKHRKRRKILTGLCLSLCPLWLTFSFIATAAKAKRLDMPTQERPRIRAPELTGHRGWLNTDKPLSLAGLKGKVVLLDFWTYGCINCIHIMPILEQLEQKYGDSLVVVGVHSAKFANEGQTDNIRQIILRYGLDHPVINDSDFRVWNAYSRYGV